MIFFRIAVLAALSVLAVGCQKEDVGKPARQEAACELEIRHFYTLHPQSDATEIMSMVDIRLCMRAHGFVPVDRPPCPYSKSKEVDQTFLLSQSTREAKCYAPDGS